MRHYLLVVAIAVIANVRAVDAASASETPYQSWSVTSEGRPPNATWGGELWVPRAESGKPNQWFYVPDRLSAVLDEAHQREIGYSRTVEVLNQIWTVSKVDGRVRVDSRPKENNTLVVSGSNDDRINWELKALTTALVMGVIGVMVIVGLITYWDVQTKARHEEERAERATREQEERRNAHQQRRLQEERDAQVAKENAAKAASTRFQDSIDAANLLRTLHVLRGKILTVYLFMGLDGRVRIDWYVASDCAYETTVVGEVDRDTLFSERCVENRFWYSPERSGAHTFRFTAQIAGTFWDPRVLEEVSCTLQLAGPKRDEGAERLLEIERWVGQRLEEGSRLKALKREAEVKTHQRARAERWPDDELEYELAGIDEIFIRVRQKLEDE